MENIKHTADPIPGTPEFNNWIVIDDREAKNGEQKIWIQEGYGNWSPICDMVGLNQIENARKIVSAVNQSRPQIDSVIAIITDSGDESVGIFPQRWEVQCPFFRDEDQAEVEHFRKELIRVYGPFCAGRCTVDFDFEGFDEVDF